MIPWIEYGKSYISLCRELERKSQDIVGIQIEYEYGTYNTIFKAFIGNISSDGDISNEGYITIDNCKVLRYRRIFDPKDFTD